jgi:hypothetical protein
LNPKFMLSTLVCCLLPTLIFSSPSLGAETMVPQAQPVTSFSAISDLPPLNSGASQVQGGAPADPADYPASFYAASNLGACTATLVSSRVLLTAAHCVNDGRRITLSRTGTTYDAICTRSDAYKSGDVTADWALCLISVEVPASSYERINSRPELLKVRDVVTITGFGCTNSDRSGGNNGIYRYGQAIITNLPLTSNNIIAKATNTNGGALCPGDSGGPTFGVLKRNGSAHRYIVGVNSRVGIATDGFTLTSTSYLASTSTRLAQKFFLKWITANGGGNIIAICGLSDAAEKCRQN